VPPQIDYAALAEQARTGVVDYAALAAQARAVDFSNVTSGRDTAKPPSTARRTRVGMFDIVYGPMVDAAEGFASGAASTTFRGGDWIRRRLGMDRVLDTPEVQAGITPPDSLAGKLGFLAEQGAEFASPGMRAARAVAKAPRLVRMGVDAAVATGVAGVQSGGDTEQMQTAGALGAVLPPVVGGLVRGARALVGATQRAASGAAEGGFGGAVANVIRSTVPISSKSMFTSAIKPRAVLVKFDATLDRALPELKATEEALGRPIANLDDLLEATTLAKRRVRAQYNEMAGPQHEMGSTVDLKPVADAMEQSIPSKVKLEDPRKVGKILDTADLYRQRRFGLEEAEQLLMETNAELEIFYAKFPQAQRRALAFDPDAARLEAQARTLRTAIYETLDAPGQGAAARELQRRYGALLEVEEETFRRYNVARRQQPEGLAEQFAGARAAGQFAQGAWKLAHGNWTGAANIAAGHGGRQAAKFMRDQQSTDKLIERAFASFKGAPEPVAMPGQPRIAGLLNRGPLVTPPPADPSFARGVPAEYAEREAAAPGFTEGEILPPLPPRQLPSGPEPAGLLSPGRDRVFPMGPSDGAPPAPPLATIGEQLAAKQTAPPLRPSARPVLDLDAAIAATPDAGASRVFVARANAGPSELWARALVDARKQGYKGSVATLRKAFDTKIASARRLKAETETAGMEYGKAEFLKSIRDLGGIRPYTLDRMAGAPARKNRAEFVRVQSLFKDYGKSAVFRNTGLGLDDMVGQLRQDPRWKHILDEDADLLAVLDDIATEIPKAKGDLQHYLRGAGVEPGVPWWEQ
jgi:hypothetical protein